MISEYFVLEQDLYYKSGIHFPVKHFYRIHPNIIAGDYSVLNDCEIVQVEPSKFNLYPDILSEQIFMVKQNIFDIINLFSQDTPYSMRFLMDKRNRVVTTYYIPHLPLVNCLSPRSEKPGKHNLDKIILNTDIIPKGIHIFQLGEAEKHIVVVSMAMLEAILRRFPSMISYVRILIDEVKS